MSEHKANGANDLNARDAELAARLARALDRSVDLLDADARAHLAAARQRALTRTYRRVAGAVALAASILVLAAMPWMLQQHRAAGSAQDIAYMSVDPEMLADMDMLMAIGEPQQ